ncbi:hypothetical protein SAMN05216188_11934 [Lentzea xinjiangensis]|uniref:Uncharacterized protein n=2 Tax=Lentzea xinjiangensis TaxID=402600 RepID=A0A1H9TRR8_9PSEU|nr:hypothetical protein SAMN05216188_11934 [Lentzea xinjiangensis]
MLAAVLSTAAPVAAQAEEQSVVDELARCAQQVGGSLSSMEIQALCAGVPSRTADEIATTTRCVASAPQTNIAAYREAAASCITQLVR